MRPGREIDTRIAKEVFGHDVWAKNKILFENAEKGERPLRNYSKEIEWAMEVAKKMKLALLPVAGGQWFAFVGPENENGWESPQSMLKFLEAGQFNDCGAAVGENAAAVICEAALKATEKRTAAALNSTRANSESPETQGTQTGAIDRDATEAEAEAAHDNVTPIH